MRILILGGDGMIGHQCFQQLHMQHHVKVTLHQSETAYQSITWFTNQNSYFNVDVCQLETVSHALRDFLPDVVINATGIVKQLKTAQLHLPIIHVNALFPHQLAELAAAYGARVIQITPDCVFDGMKGDYLETDVANAQDLYGRTKFLGELPYPHCFTLRTSFVGLELSRKVGLIEWFLKQRSDIKGFKKAIYTGLTTMELSRVIADIINNHPDLSGVWQVASEKITKFDLLTQLKEKVGFTDVNIFPDDDFFCDRSLLANRFNTATGYVPPSWDDMLDELAEQIREREQHRLTAGSAA